MKRLFVETEVFQDDARRLGVGIEQIRELQNELLENPEKGALIPRSGGCRKARLGKKGRSGKSGGHRVLYTDFGASETLYMWMIFGKDEQANLTPDQKKWLKAMNLEISRELRRRR